MRHALKLAVFAAAGMLACGTEPAINGNDDRQRVDVVRIAAMTDEEKALWVLERFGYDVELVVPIEDGYVVEGDIVFETEDLVARANALVKKGYWCGQALSELDSYVGNCQFEPIQMNMSTGIALTYVDGSDPISDAFLRMAFLAAARYWSQAHDKTGRGSELYIDGRVAHKKPSFYNIEIRVTNLGFEPVARGRWPAYTIWGVRPGRMIEVNSAAGKPYATKNLTELTKAAIHELGHTLGFAHAGEDTTIYEHIDGTESGTDYETIMQRYLADSPRPALSADDELSLVKMYSNWANDLPATPNDDFCKDTLGPQMRNGCDVGEGDCDSEGTDAECKDNLECAHDAGLRWELPSHYDVCEKPATCSPYSVAANPDYCNSIECPCGPLEGDCDVNSHCGGRLICGKDLGLAVGKPESWDICILPPIPGCPKFKKSEIGTYAEFCSESCPCNLGEGDCDNDDECRGELRCRTAGSALGYGGAQADWEFCVGPDFD
jgi:hypothetical protein